MRKYTLATVIVLLSICTAGCNSLANEYKQTGVWAPNSFGYTISRDRQTGELVDYFNVNWQFK